LFATHSRFTEDPKQSFLLTYDGKMTLDDLERLIRIGEFRDQRVDLLVLSSCETAEGDERAALGLAGVAVKAGVSSVLASLWSVNDPSTAELVPLFFEHLNDSRLSTAQALQKAQQHLLSSAEYRHPFHWAPFVLIGRWY
jgi:CHAT domain-containing protein